MKKVGELWKPVLGWRYFYTITWLWNISLNFTLARTFLHTSSIISLGAISCTRKSQWLGYFTWPSSTVNESSLLAVSIFQLWTFIKAGMPGTEDLLQRKASKRTRLVKTHMFDLHDNKSFNVWYFHIQCSKVHG